LSGCNPVATHRNRHPSFSQDEQRLIAHLKGMVFAPQEQGRTGSTAMPTRNDTHLKAFALKGLDQCDDDWGLASPSWPQIAHHNDRDRKANRGGEANTQCPDASGQKAQRAQEQVEPTATLPGVKPETGG
jgi:hypothetical protein